MSNEHVHKYLKTKVSDKWSIYRCVLTDCSHYINISLIPGRKSICWVCDKEFVIPSTANANRLAKKPACCRGNGRINKRDVIKEDAVDNVLGKLGLV